MYELINEDNTFYLNPNENIPLVFRYLHLSPTTQKHKTVNVIIMKEDSNWIVGGFTLDVHLQEPIIQHSYVYNHYIIQIIRSRRGNSRSHYSCALH